MAGVSTPSLAAAASNAGGLGSIGIGASDVPGARAMIDETFAQTDRHFNVNVFVHGPAAQDPEREAAWLAALEPVFAEFGAAAPYDLRVIYKSFVDDPEMLSLLVEEKPAVVSFHFGLPPAETITALKDAGIRLFATATSLAEAEAVKVAAQLGTAFIACPSLAADDDYRAALKGQGAFHTRLTTAISGRPARACQPVHGTGGNNASRNHAARLSHCLRRRKGPSRRRQSRRRGWLRCAMGGARCAARACHARSRAYGNARA